jgi:hypothetical protein
MQQATRWPVPVFPAFNFFHGPTGRALFQRPRPLLTLTSTAISAATTYYLPSLFFRDRKGAPPWTALSISYGWSLRDSAKAGQTPPTLTHMGTSVCFHPLRGLTLAKSCVATAQLDRAPSGHSTIFTKNFVIFSPSPGFLLHASDTILSPCRAQA